MNVFSEIRTKQIAMFKQRLHNQRGFTRRVDPFEVGLSPMSESLMALFKAKSHSS